MKTGITAIINQNGDEEGLARTVNSVAGWTSEIVVVKQGRGTSGRKISGWFLGLNSGEEVSIPLKREIRTLFEELKKVPGRNNPDAYLIPIIRNTGDTWKLVCKGSARLFFAGGKGITGTLANPIRDYLTHKSFPDIRASVRIRRILVVKLRGIGDTVLLTPLFKALKKSFKGVLIDAVVRKESASLLSGHTNISTAIAYEGFFRTLLKLRRNKYDIALVSQASFRSALLARLSGAKLLSVNNHNGRNYFSSVRVKKPQEYENAAERDLDCLRAFGLKAQFSQPKISVSADEQKKARALLIKYGARKNTKVIIINPSASKRNKIWPEKSFSLLVDKISSEKNVKVLLLADPANSVSSAITASLAKSEPVLLPLLGLREVLGLLSVAALYIGNDSGLSHAAAALGTATITIVGPDEPVIFHPYKEGQGHYLVSKDRFCKPCWKENCEGRECLEIIKPADVYKEYLKWKK